MVKRIITLSFVFFLIFIFTVPIFAYDNAQSESDWFGFSYDNSGIYMFQNTLDGSYISVDNQSITCNKIYFYFPCSIPAESLEYHYSLLSLGGGLSFNSADYGEIYGGEYHILGSITGTRANQIGVQQIEGSNAKMMSFFCRFGADPLPFDSFNSYRYIRLSLDCSNNFTIVNWLNKANSNASYSLTATQGNQTGQITSGKLDVGGYYITGSLKQKWWDGDSVETQTGYLLNGTSGTGGYLYVPSHSITSNASSPLKFSIAGGNIVGSLTPDSANSIARTYTKVVTVSGTRTYNDKEMIEAVQDASDRNHTDITNASDRNHTDITNASNRNHNDLTNISNQMQQIIDHQEGLEQQGDAINGTTSTSTINNTSSTVNSGTSAVSNMAGSVASDVNSTSSQYTGYLGFLGDGMEVMFNHLQPLYIWFGACFLIPMILWMFRHATSGGDD